MGDVVAQPPALVGRVVRMAGQLAIIVGLEKIYQATRGLIPQQAKVALDNGLAVVGLEKNLNIFDEWKVQAIVFRHKEWLIGPFALDQRTIIYVINHFYLYSHFIGTLMFLAWLYMFQHRHFPFVRDVIFITTGLALVIYVVFPMMPPRLMGQRMHLPYHYTFHDTLAPILNYKLQASQIGFNPYAAMPSLHFAWALILGVTLVWLGRNVMLRLLGLLYPVMMLATILISGNHLFLDAVGSLIVVVVAVIVALIFHRRLGGWRGLLFVRTIARPSAAA